MSKKVKYNKDKSVTVILNGRDKTSFWVEVDRETQQWIDKGYRLIDVVKGGNSFKDSILTSIINMFRMLLNMSEKHDPEVRLTFSK